MLDHAKILFIAANAPPREPTTSALTRRETPHDGAQFCELGPDAVNFVTLFSRRHRSLGGGGMFRDYLDLAKHGRG